MVFNNKQKKGKNLRFDCCLLNKAKAFAPMYLAFIRSGHLAEQEYTRVVPIAYLEFLLAIRTTCTSEQESKPTNKLT